MLFIIRGMIFINSYAVKTSTTPTVTSLTPVYDGTNIILTWTGVNLSGIPLQITSSPSISQLVITPNGRVAAGTTTYTITTGFTLGLSYVFSITPQGGSKFNASAFTPTTAISSFTTSFAYGTGITLTWAGTGLTNVSIALTSGSLGGFSSPTTYSSTNSTGGSATIAFGWTGGITYTFSITTNGVTSGITPSVTIPSISTPTITQVTSSTATVSWTYTLFAPSTPLTIYQSSALAGIYTQVGSSTLGANSITLSLPTGPDYVYLNLNVGSGIFLQSTVSAPFFYTIGTVGSTITQTQTAYNQKTIGFTTTNYPNGTTFTLYTQTTASPVSYTTSITGWSSAGTCTITSGAGSFVGITLLAATNSYFQIVGGTTMYGTIASTPALVSAYTLASGTINSVTTTATTITVSFTATNTNSGDTATIYQASTTGGTAVTFGATPVLASSGTITCSPTNGYYIFLVITSAINGTYTSSAYSTAISYVTAADPYWSSVVLYCRFDETAGSTTFTDQTGKQTITAFNSQTLTPAGNSLPSPQISANGNSAFGNFLGPTVTGGLNSAITANQQTVGFGITIAPSSSLYLGTNNFTIEMFVYTPNNGTNALYTDSKNGGNANRLAGNMAGSGQYWGPNAFVIIPPTQGFGFQINNTGSGPGATNASYSTVAGWHHYAITRNGSNFYVYVDGVVRSNPYTYAGTVDVANRTWTFGYAWDVSAGTYTNCFIDELRVTIGVDRYNNGATFTVPTSEFPNHS